ncbi:MAG TPA: sulfate adenylyltransferase subunit CysN [Pirellulales bacterium]|jgi:bifunctional enzyme CysN/CysC|nr:sulfate adenylyltransferase subunit CysN [Pirellulales bacterium]
MSNDATLIERDIDAYLARHERKELLRFLTCGSVDDGKSTLIGRLLHDSKQVYEDQLAAVVRDSEKKSSAGGEVDLSLLVDGLKAEREQGITIDVAYRYFSTEKRKFIIADCPGHEQYTRNMATGASTCNLAVILIDARYGILQQTRRHSFIVSLLGIRHVAVAVNKMDLVDYSQQVFEQIKRDYADFAAKLDMGDLHFLPLSALRGDNVVEPSANMPWYQGGTLMHYLDTVYIASDRNLIDLRFPVQYVLRPNLDYRAFAGTLASGVIRRGDEIATLPSGRRSRVERIVTYDGELNEAFAPMSISITLADEIDVSRGDMLVHPGNLPRVDRTLEAMIVWMAEQPLRAGKQYLLKQTTKTALASVSTLRYRVDVNTLHRQEAAELNMNEVGRVTVTANQPLAFDPYRKNRATGAFILIDRLSNVTVGAGMIIDSQSDRGAIGHDYWSAEPQAVPSTEHAGSQVAAAEREARFGQRPATILLTGLTGAGKSTIAYALERRLFDAGRAACVLDGEQMRRGISRDLGFTAGERSENLRRSAEAARLMNDAGLICICAFLAPSADVRSKARDVVGDERFLEVYLSAPLDVCRRDTSGMYAKADSGEIADFPGVSAPYDVPQSPDLTLATDQLPVEICVERIIALLEERGIIA